MKRWLVLALLSSCCVVTDLQAAQVMKWLLGSQATLLSTELNSLANNAYTVASGIFNNTVAGGTGDGYALCDLEFTGTFGASPVANSGVSVWLLMTSDGTNYENTPTAAITLGRAPDVVLPATTGQTGTRVIRRTLCPWGNFKAVLKNDGTGQALAASANTLKIRFVTLEGISQ